MFVAAHTEKICNIYRFPKATMTHEHASTLRYTYIVLYLASVSTTLTQSPETF
jgi:hypothetical protein